MVNEQRIPKGYKKTEVGVIPEDWDVSDLRSCLIAPPDYGINAPAVPFDNNLPSYIRITDITNEGKFEPSPRVSVIHSFGTDYFLQPGDIVFARTGASVGKSYMYDPDDGALVYAGYLIRVKPNPDKLLPEYLFQYVRTKMYWNWVATVSLRSGQPGINGQEYGNLVIPLPPLPEQRAIAAALSDVDGLLSALDALIAKKRALKTAAMQSLLTGRIRLPGFTGEWCKACLGDVCKIYKGLQINRDTLSPNGLFPVWNGGVEPSGYTYKWNTEPNTITISEGGNSCGFVNFIREKFWLGGHCYAIEPIKVERNFLYQLLKFQEPGLMALRVGSGLPNIQRKRLEDFIITFPVSNDEQRAIAAVLADMDAEIAALEARREKVRQVKQGMMQVLLTGKVRLVNKDNAV
jgi:type I restriction enzyme S subunit